MTNKTFDWSFYTTPTLSEPALSLVCTFIPIMPHQKRPQKGVKASSSSGQKLSRGPSPKVKTAWFPELIRPRKRHLLERGEFFLMQLRLCRLLLGLRRYHKSESGWNLLHD